MLRFFIKTRRLSLAWKLQYDNYNNLISLLSQLFRICQVLFEIYFTSLVNDEVLWSIKDNTYLQRTITHYFFTNVQLILIRRIGVRFPGNIDRSMAMNKSSYLLTPERKVSCRNRGWACDVSNVLYIYEPVGQSVSIWSSSRKQNGHLF